MPTFLQRKIKPIISSSYARILGLFVLCFGIHSAMLFSIPYFADLSDSFYHAKMGELYASGMFPLSFPWLFYTTLHEHFVNHHLLFHLGLVPFIWLGRVLQSISIHLDPTIWGTKLAIVTFLSSATVLFYHGLGKFGVRMRWPWILLFFALPVDFFFRHYAIRVHSFSLCFLLLGMFAAWERKYVMLFVVSFFYAWVYGGFFYLPIAVGIHFLISGFLEKKWDWKLIIASFGVAVGFVVSPNFPYNVSFMIQQVFDSGLGMKIAVGGEWYPYKLDEFLWMSMTPLLLLFFTCVYSIHLWVSKRIKEIPTNVWSTFFFSLLFLLLTLKSKRFIEYWPVFSLMGSAGILSHITEKYARLTKSMMSVVMTSLIFLFILYLWGVPYFFFEQIHRSIFTNALPLITGIGIILCLAGISSASDESWDYIRTFPLFGRLVLVPVVILSLGVMLSMIPYGFAKNHAYISYYDPAIVNDARATMQCLQKDSKQGDIVFTDDWDIFPLYFFMNSKNYYIVGLDPIFLFNFNKKLYDEFVDITTGRFDEERLLETLQKDFHAQYVITDTDHRELRGQMNNQDLNGKLCGTTHFQVHKIESRG